MTRTKPRLSEESIRNASRQSRARFRAAVSEPCGNESPGGILRCVFPAGHLCSHGDGELTTWCWSSAAHFEVIGASAPTLLERVKCSCGHPKGWHYDAPDVVDWSCTKCPCARFEGATHAR